MKPKAEMTTSLATSPSDIPGFESVNITELSEKTLTYEDLQSRRKQLWLIKVPYEFDVSKLTGTTVVLSGSQDLTAKLDEQNSGKRYESRASKYAQDETCPFKMVVPLKAENSLKVAKDFSGHMDVIQTVKVPMLVYPPTPPPMYTDIPKGLKQRWKPFGHRTPPKIDRKNNINKGKNASVGEKRKRWNGMKTERRQSSKTKKMKNESGYGSSLALDDSDSSPKQKKKRH